MESNAVQSGMPKRYDTFSNDHLRQRRLTNDHSTLNDVDVGRRRLPELTEHTRFRLCNKSCKVHVRRFTSDLNGSGLSIVDIFLSRVVLDYAICKTNALHDLLAAINVIYQYYVTVLRHKFSCCRLDCITRRTPHPDSYRSPTRELS